MTDPPQVSLHLTLPLPPGINSQYVTVGKRRVLSAGASRFKKEVATIVNGLRERPEWPVQDESRIRESLLGMYLTFYFKTPMKRDLDGGLKIAIDAIAESLGFDDRTIVDLHLTKQIDPLHSRLEVDLETIAEWSFDQSYVYLGEKED